MVCWGHIWYRTSLDKEWGIRPGSRSRQSRNLPVDGKKLIKSHFWDSWICIPSNLVWADCSIRLFPTSIFLFSPLLSSLWLSTIDVTTKACVLYYKNGKNTEYKVTDTRLINSWLVKTVNNNKKFYDWNSLNLNLFTCKLKWRHKLITKSILIIC